MTDSHFHFYEWSIGNNLLTLEDTVSLDDLLERITVAAGKQGAGTWILGRGWDETQWQDRKIPKKEELDRVAPNNPVLLWRCDMHMAVANSSAFETAGISKDTPDPPGGVISRDGSGIPDGILRELAPELIKAVLPEPGEDEIYEAMCAGISTLHSMGLTGLNDIRSPGGRGWKTAYQIWKRIKEDGELNLRCRTSVPWEYLDDAIELGLKTGFGDERLCIGHAKFFVDGSMGARTAWMIDPYRDAEIGMPMMEMSAMSDLIFKEDRAGFSVMAHAIGDRANRELITIFENLEKEAPQKEKQKPPHRIEHVQMIRSEDIQRLSALDVVANVQPHNVVLDINMMRESVGDLGKLGYRFRDMLDAGIHVLYSSDCPVCSPSPISGIHAAVTRQRKDGTPSGGWYPKQRISVEEAVKGYTIGPAVASGCGGVLGSITKGKYADFVVLDRDIYTCDPMDIVNTKVDMTIFNGKAVYKRPV